MLLLSGMTENKLKLTKTSCVEEVQTVKENVWPYQIIKNRCEPCISFRSIVDSCSPVVTALSIDPDARFHHGSSNYHAMKSSFYFSINRFSCIVSSLYFNML